MGICRLPPRGKPKQILPRPKLESHSPTGETHNGNYQNPPTGDTHANGFYLVPKGESFPPTGGRPKGNPARPQGRVIPPTGETHNGNLQKGSSNIASPIKERGRKEKTQARTSAIKENSFQTSCTKAQLPKDAKVQRHKSTGTASNSLETSPKNGAKP